MSCIAVKLEKIKKKKRIKRLYHAKLNQKKAAIALLISEMEFDLSHAKFNTQRKLSFLMPNCKNK